MCVVSGVPPAESIHPKGKAQCLGMASVLDAHGGVVMDIVDAVAAPLLGFQGERNKAAFLSH